MIDVLAAAVVGVCGGLIGTVAVAVLCKSTTLGDGMLDEADEERLESWLHDKQYQQTPTGRIARLVQQRTTHLAERATTAEEQLDEVRRLLGLAAGASVTNELRGRLGGRGRGRYTATPVKGMTPDESERALEMLNSTLTWTEGELWHGLVSASRTSAVRGLCATALRAQRDSEAERQQLRDHITRAVATLSVSLPAGATQGKDLIGIAELLNDRAMAHNRESTALAGLLDKLETETLQAAALRVTIARDLAQEGLAAELTAKEARAGSPDAYDQLTEDLAKVRLELGEIRKLVLPAGDQSTLSSVQDTVRDLLDVTTRAVKFQRDVTGALGHAKYADPAEFELLEELDTLRTVLGAHPGQLASVRASDVMGELKLLHEHVASEPTQTFRPPYRVTIEHNSTEYNGKYPPKAVVVFEIVNPEFFGLSHGQRLGVVVLRGE